MRKLSYALLLIPGVNAALAQEFSYDGNRWYEVEVSVFTNEVPGAELPVARKLTAAYLPRLRELQTRSSAFMIEFPEDLPPPAITPAGPTALPETPAAPLVTMGPIYSPAVREGFKITDFDHDPFVDLGTRAARFTAMNREIDGDAGHRMLWHKVWRQPMQGRAQTEAVFVKGGDAYAAHNELEGSLRLSDNAGGVMLDINVWLNGFAMGPPSVAEPAEEWRIPELPFPDIEPAQDVPMLNVPAPGPETNMWHLSHVWQLAQTRELGANQLYYLDHPALGVLIEIRPYVLPPRVAAEGEEDF